MPVAVNADAGKESDLFECSVSFVLVEELGSGVVGDKYIDPTIANPHVAAGILVHEAHHAATFDRDVHSRLGGSRGHPPICNPASGHYDCRV